MEQAAARLNRFVHRFFSPRTFEIRRLALRWKIPVKELTGGGRRNAGIAIIPKAKEIMMASSQMNKVVKFYFPELFE